MQKLIQELSRLPSIGEKSAVRLAYHLLTQDQRLGRAIGSALEQALGAVRLCDRCFFLSESPLCTVCSDTSRDDGYMCVVEKPSDVMAVERSGEFRGYYHVLHGVWAPLKGKGPESMKLKELLERLKVGNVKEVIIGTSATVEGDATALYIAKLLGAINVKSTRLAQGIPKGGELEYADDITLARAFQGRSLISSGT